MNKNTIKRNTNTLKVKTLIDFNNGSLPKGTTLIIKKEQDIGWFGGGYQWLVSHLRNGDILQILEQV